MNLLLNEGVNVKETGSQEVVGSDEVEPMLVPKDKLSLV